MKKKKVSRKAKVRSAIKSTKPKKKTLRIRLDKEFKLSENIPTRNNNAKLFLAGTIFVAIIILLIILFYSGNLIGGATKTQCDTPKCFIEKANACEPAEYITTIGTTTIKMEIKQGCRLKKTILSLDETEPQEIREYFKGKSMTCDYEKDNFDNDFAFQISGPLDNCKGDLVDAIKAVI
ncbi:hypothetical protein DRJ25_02925 [Candidatus Woesearchaeota archaeon]|nr:MAG: hypothetical protein DRJ25_02925 [Candidatus Woesearchaeota archaeon]